MPALVRQCRYFQHAYHCVFDIVSRQHSQYSEFDTDVDGQSEAIRRFVKPPQREFSNLNSPRFGVRIPLPVVVIRIPESLFFPANEPPCGCFLFRDTAGCFLSSLYQSIGIRGNMAPGQACGFVKVFVKTLLQKRPKMLEQGLVVVHYGAQFRQLV